MVKYLIITGGSRGIGKATIEWFIKNDYNVINLSRSPCLIADVHNLSVDLAHLDNINELASQLKDAMPSVGKLCLVHNAAEGLFDNIMTVQPNALRQSLEVNLIAAVQLNQLCLPLMKPGSSIIYIGSTLSEKSVPNSASYTISKHALAGLMKATCQDLAGEGIHTCCVCPGFVNTEMLTSRMPEKELKNLIDAKVTAQRLIEPSEIANFIYYCAQNPIINGAMLHVNLGQVSD
jgi:3-oxoacyl-[acyl-carrier protein] reductase